MMMRRKTRVFLGAFVNYTNAQNLNCLALTKHLDKSKYEVMTGIGYSGDLPIEQFLGVHYLKMRYPARIWRPLCFVWGIAWCDVAYLPAPMHWRLCRWLLRLFHKPAFKTVEGMFIGSNLEKALVLEKTKLTIKESLAYTGNTFSITRAMRLMNERILGLSTLEKILYLGVEISMFENFVERGGVEDICIIGSNLFYKGLGDYFVLAKRFPSLRFHIVGSGMGNVDPVTEAKRLGLKNVVCHGQLSHADLRYLLETVQLHVFPSRAEGFPKVTLECAAAGVPSLVYDDYGADEWITTNKDGFVVKTLDEMVSVIDDLLCHPERLQPLADNARTLAKRFDWMILVKDWESVIDELAGLR